MFTNKEEGQIDRAVIRAARVIDSEHEKMFSKLPVSDDLEYQKSQTAIATNNAKMT